MATPRDDLDTLLENTRWVRALGRELSGAGEADDLVQDAWLVALERPGGVLNPPAWFSGVLRQLARRARRSGERRLRRERAAARPEAQPPADELVAEAEIQRELIRAVTELAEPQRSTVLLRYFRGWTSEEIARSEGVPAATVRTRLHRALARLRERLDRAHGGREAWAVAFAGAPALGGAGSVTGGVLLGTKLKLVAVALIAVLGGVALWRGTGTSAGGSMRVEEPGARTADAPAVTSIPAAAGDVRDASERREALPAGPLPAAAEVLVYGSVLEPSGARVALDWITLRDEEGNSRSNKSSTAGVWSIAGLHPGRWQLDARAAGHVERREELLVDGSAAHERHDLVLEPALSIRITLQDENGERLPGPREPEAGLPPVTVVATLDPPRDGIGGVTGLAPLRVGEYRSRSRFEPMPELAAGASGLLELRAALPMYVSAVLQDAVLETRHVTAPVEELVFTLERAHIEARAGGLRLRLIDGATGAPIRGQDGRVTLGLPSGVAWVAQPDADGRIAFERQAPGLHELELLWKGYEQVEKTVRVPSGRSDDLGDFALFPAATIRGRVLDARGEPVSTQVTWIALAHLELPLDADTRYSTSTLDAGRFEITTAARGPVLLLVADEERTLCAQQVDASSGLVEGVELRIADGVEVSFRSALEGTLRQVTLADEHGVPLATWSIWGAGAVKKRLPAGRYQLWTGEAERVDAVAPLVVGAEPMVVEIARGVGR